MSTPLKYLIVNISEDVDLGGPPHDAVHGEEKVVSSLEVDHDLTLGRTQETQNSQFWGGRYISYDLTLSN